MSIGPRLRVLYLATVAVGVLLLRTPLAISAVVAVQLALWPAAGLPARRLARQLAKLVGFAAFLVASYAFTADDPATDRWIHLALPAGVELPLNVGGAMTGALLVLRVVAVILASQVARAGDARAVAQGLSELGVPRVVAVPIDTVLALMGDEPRGKGRGNGRGNGRGGGRGGWLRQSFARLRQGDVGPLVERMQRLIERAERHVEAQEDGRRPRPWIRDVAVIAGVSLTMLGVKALKILPSIPFAPGHKLVVLTPLYVAASLLTRHRFGATLTGLTMGSVAFLLGDGKYGVFEILKHVAPGLLCDLCVPLVVARGRQPGRVAWTVLGGVVAAGRFATIFAMVLLVQAPGVAYAILLPGLCVHVGFGMLSGLVSFHLWRALDRARADVPDGAPATVGLITKELP
jgi:hypothetical protein